MKNLLLFLLLVCSSGVIAQNVDYNKIILPEKAADLSFEERLVQLSWKNHPSNRIVQQEVAIYTYQKKQAQWSWLEDIYAVGNLNEFTLDKNNSDPNNPNAAIDRSSFYPRYNFGVRVSLGTFAVTPMRVKESKARIASAEYAVDEKKLGVRNDVLIGISRLKEQYIVLRLRVRLAEDLLVMYKDAEQKFSLGQINIDQYRNTAQAYYVRAESVVNSESLFNQRKIDLETLIGVKLEDVAGYSEYLKSLDSQAGKI